MEGEEEQRELPGEWGVRSAVGADGEQGSGKWGARISKMTDKMTNSKA